MANLSEVAVDAVKQVEGIWVQFDADSWVKLARINNPEHVRFINKQARKQVGGFRQGSKESEKHADFIDTEGRARYVVMDWHNIENADGPMEATLQNKIWALSKVPAFQRFVFIHAQDDRLFFSELPDDDDLPVTSQTAPWELIEQVAITDQQDPLETAVSQPAEQNGHVAPRTLEQTQENLSHGSAGRSTITGSAVTHPANRP